MKIVIIGAGKVGEALIEHLSEEEHSITVVDLKADLVEKLRDHFDIIGVVGNGASYDVQKQTEMENADMLIAVTNSDEANILCCLTGKRMGAKYSVARVRNPEYSSHIDFMTEDLGINLIINPELEAANDIYRILSYPMAVSVETFAKGKVKMFGIDLDEDTDLDGVSLIDLKKEYGHDILVCVVERDDKVTIPDGNFKLHGGDRIYVTGELFKLQNFFKSQKIFKSRAKSVMIIGGGKITYYLCKMLVKNKVEVKIIEIDKKRCEELSRLIPKVEIINNDGSLQEVMEEEHIASYDVAISLTNIDEENIIISLYAKDKGVNKTITKLSRRDLIKILERVGLDTPITPKDIAANRIVRYVRAKQNSIGSSVETLYKTAGDKVESLEFKVSPTFKGAGITLRDLKLKSNMLIALIIRDRLTIYPRGNDTIECGDRVIVVTTHLYLDDLNDILL